MTALSNALERTVVDWTSVKRIVGRQKSFKALFTSLERLLQVPRVPLDIVCCVLNRMKYNLADDDICDKLTSFSPSKCIHAIWYKVLVDRSSVAPGYIRCRLDASEQYTSELLAITDDASLLSNEVIYEAFEVTKMVVHALFQRGWNPNYSTSNNNTFVSLVIVEKLHPFLIWLAVAQDPNCLFMGYNANDFLPLEEAFRTIRFAITPCQWSIRFPMDQMDNQSSHSEHAKILELFNKRTAVQLLCHLSVRANQSSSRPCNHENQAYARMPLDSFLHSLYLERPLQFQLPVHDDSYYLSRNELMEDIRAVVFSAPLALETRNREFGLFPFCLPQLQPSPPESEEMECFLLSLAYDLLRSKPDLVAPEHLNLSLDETAYEKVSKQWLQSERDKYQKLLQEYESLKRDATALREEVATLKREASQSSPTKRHRCP